LTVINALNATWIDFDIEGEALKNITATTLRNKALVIIQKQFVATKKPLTVSFTLPVLPTAFTADVLDLLKRAKSANVTINVLNVMAMNFGLSNAPKGSTMMAEYAKQAVNTARKTGAASKYGVTVMIGQNDVKTEIFREVDATILAPWIRNQTFISYASFWSANRDNVITPYQPRTGFFSRTFAVK
jgi:chitinase